MFFLFLATILIMVLIWKNDHPIAEYAKTGVRLSDLSEQECKVIDMKMIRPVSDLRNNFAEISKTVHETAQPVFFFFYGYGDMVVLSMEAYENLQFESEVYCKLQQAEQEAALTGQRYSSKDVLAAMKDAIKEK